VNSGVDIFYVNPLKSEYYGETYIPQRSFSRVKINNVVLIKLHSYPYEEFGYLKGYISRISEIPLKDSLFLAHVKLYQLPKDSYINLKPGITADAEIISDNRSILQRILENITRH